VQCPNCSASFCIDCEKSLGPHEFRCPKCLDLYEEQRRKDHQALDELGPNAKCPALDACKAVAEELIHAREAFSMQKDKLNKDHCAWCRRAWMANWENL